MIDPRDYEKLVAEYGDSPLSLGWGEKDRRRERFRVLTENWNLHQASILDLGCGFGDLYGFVTESVELFDYLGIDNSPKILKIAESKYPGASFKLMNIEEIKTLDFRADFTFASGIFNDQRSNHILHVKSIMDYAVEISRFGFSFNFLSTLADIRYPDSQYTSPSTIANYCESRKWRFSINHQYMPFEFTVHVNLEANFDPKKNIFESYFDNS